MPTSDASIPAVTTPPSEWRKVRQEGFIIQLPSGKWARIKRTLSLLTAMRNGSIPNPLAKRVEKLISGEQRALRADNMTEEEFEALKVLINEETLEIWVEPKVYEVPDGENPMTWNPDDPNGVSITDISWEDRSFAYSFAQGGPASLDRFSELLQDVEAVPDGDSVPPVAEPPAED